MPPSVLSNAEYYEQQFDDLLTSLLTDHARHRLTRSELNEITQMMHAKAAFAATCAMDARKRLRVVPRVASWSERLRHTLAGFIGLHCRNQPRSVLAQLRESTPDDAA